MLNMDGEDRGVLAIMDMPAVDDGMTALFAREEDETYEADAEWGNDEEEKAEEDETDGEVDKDIATSAGVVIMRPLKWFLTCSAVRGRDNANSRLIVLAISDHHICVAFSSRAR